MPKVDVMRVNGDSAAAIDRAVAGILSSFKVMDAVRGGAVVIKPNLGTTLPSGSGGTTDLRIVEALCRRLSGICRVTLAEGVGRGYTAEEVFGALGVGSLIDRYGIKVTDLEKDEYVETVVPKPLLYPAFKMPRTILEADYVINVPVMKTHNQTTVSLGLKNMFGCLCQMERARCHFFGLNESISDLNQVVPSDLVIADGLHGMDGNGPTGGKARADNILVASDSVVAADLFSAKIMGFSQADVRHLRMALKWSGLKAEDVNVSGQLPALSFEPAPQEAGYAYPRLGKWKRSILQRYVRLSEFRIDDGKCVRCGVCRKACPQNAIGPEFQVDDGLCRNCGICREFCRHGAVSVKKKIGFRNLGWLG
jgi:uncharacterized protein (DUF362 family)/ferredoxin